MAQKKTEVVAKQAGLEYAPGKTAEVGDKFSTDEATAAALRAAGFVRYADEPDEASIDGDAQDAADVESIIAANTQLAADLQAAQAEVAQLREQLAASQADAKTKGDEAQALKDRLDAAAQYDVAAAKAKK